MIFKYILKIYLKKNLKCLHTNLLSLCLNSFCSLPSILVSSWSQQCSFNMQSLRLLNKCCFAPSANACGYVACEPANGGYVSERDFQHKVGCSDRTGREHWTDCWRIQAKSRTSGNGLVYAILKCFISFFSNRKGYTNISFHIFFSKNT